MSVVADFSVPAAAFCLGDALGDVPTATAELERVVAQSPMHVIPFVWFVDTDREAIDAALAEDPTVKNANITDSFEKTHLYHIDWASVVDERLRIILDHEGVVLEARGAVDKWRLWVRFASRDYFSEFQDHFSEFGEITLHQITTQQTPGGIQYGVTAKQREALLAAFDAGYFDTPRAVTAEDVAQQLDISQQSVSQRLRRGTNRLIEYTLDRHRDV